MTSVIRNLDKIRDRLEVFNLSILIKNGIIITMNAYGQIIYDGAVFIEKNLISDIGPSESLQKEYNADIVIDARGKAVLPGFINAHTHLSEKLVPGIIEDLPLSEWVNKLIFPVMIHSTLEDCYWGALLAQLEMLKSGITCFADLFDSSLKRVLGKLSETVEKSGMRGVLAREICDMELPEELPQNYSEAVIDDTVETIKKLHQGTNERVQVRFGIGGMTCVTPDLLKEIRELAYKYRVGIHTHFSETLGEVVTMKHRHGLRSIEYAYQNDLLGPDVLGAHCIWLSDKEIKILGKTKTKVVYCPVSNMKLGDGVCPVPRLLGEGITTALGTDGPGSNDNLDMFSCMKFASYLQKIYWLNPHLLPSQKVLEMATIEGAKALQLDHLIGSLEVGKLADIIVIDLTEPNITPVHDVVKQLVCSGLPGNVKTTIIDGTIVMESGKIKTVDEHKVVEKACECAKNLFERAEFGLPQKNLLERYPICNAERHF